MRAVLSRVQSAAVTVDGETVGEVHAGDSGALLALVGVARSDTQESADTMIRKIAELRILDGEQSLLTTQGSVLVVSQFTLMGRTAKGRRPSWSEAAPGDQAKPLIDYIVNGLKAQGITVAEGKFGAYMKVSSVNDGPFTVLVECD